MQRLVKGKFAVFFMLILAVTGAGLSFKSVMAQFADTEAGPQTGLKRAPLTINTASGKKNFIVEIADTPESREIGMMWRRIILANEGMIFDFKTPKYASFWMKNTFVPLDIIFIRQDGTIARVAANAKPQDLTPVDSGEPILAVLEIKGGEAKKQKITAGQKVDFSIFISNKH
jgi:uncharacterized membrane protein (UPF0127 family)